MFIQRWSSSWKGARDIEGETELSGFGGRVGRAAFSQTEPLAQAIVPLLNPPPTELAGGHHVQVSINLPNTVIPVLVRPWPTQLVGPPSQFQWLFHTNWPVLVYMLQTFLTSLKG